MRKYSIAVMGWTLWDGTGRTPTGGSVATYELTKRLSRYFECGMVFETSDRDKVAKIEDVEEGFRRRFVLRPKGFWRLDEDFLRGYDLIHIWDAAPVFMYRAFTRMFLPHCYTLHSAASMTDWIRMASAFHVDGHDMVALGSRCLAEALNRFWKITVDVIPYGVDTKIFRPLSKSDCRESFDLPKDKIVLGYLGRISKFDFALAYEIFRKVKQFAGRKDIVLLVAGGPKKIRPIHVKNDLLYLGYLEQSKVPQFFNSCDLFFNPVAGIREGFGLSVIEAMSCGLPVVTTSWNGYRDTVSSDVGFLARTCWRGGDVWINQEDLVSACVELIADESLRETMGKRARLRVEQNYGWDTCAEKYRLRFLELIRKGPPTDIPYKDAPERITVSLNGEPRVLSLEEALRNLESLRVDFQALHEGFASDVQMKGAGWKRFTCMDNIVNLPRYRLNMKNELEDLESRVSASFPRLVKALKET